MKDYRSLLLVLLSFGLVGTWIYHLYDKSQYINRTKEVYVKDSAAVAEAVRDSLRKIYSATIDQLGSEKTNSDSLASSLKGELGEKMREINLLKSQLSGILKKKNPSQTDLADARNIIKDLRRKIATMQQENSSLSEERNSLDSVLEQLNKDMTVMQQTMQRLSEENKELVQTINDASTFIASELRLAAMNLRSEEKEIETNSVKKADKFVVSFVVQNYVSDFPGAELVIAIKEPTGHIMTGEGWNTGSFDTRSEGRKEYTRKVRFEYTKGEQKRLIFSVDTEKFQKGIYKMNIYHNGIMIGEASWLLS